MRQYGFWRTLALVVLDSGVWKAIAIHVCNITPSWSILGMGNY
jgi:hypothetical protein